MGASPSGSEPGSYGPQCPVYVFGICGVFSIAFHPSLPMSTVNPEGHVSFPIAEPSFFGGGGMTFSVVVVVVVVVDVEVVVVIVKLPAGAAGGGLRGAWVEKGKNDSCEEGTVGG